MSNELLPALIGDILAFIAKVLSIISNAFRKAFSGMARITFSTAELTDAFGQIHHSTAPLMNISNVYTNAFGIFLGMLAGSIQAWYITLCVMLGESLLKLLKLTDRFKLVFNVAGTFLGCIVWELYGGRFGFCPQLSGPRRLSRDG